MKKLVATTMAFVIAAAAAVGVAEELTSGLPTGTKPVPAFNVKDVTGPSKGESLCYRCQYGARPVVTIFAREVNDNLASLIKEVDGLVKKNEAKQMRAFVVLLSDKPDAEKKLTELAAKHDIKSVPLTVFDTQAGPPAYKIAKDAEVTVMMWNKQEVKANQSFAKGKFDKKSAEGVIADTAKILN